MNQIRMDLNPQPPLQWPQAAATFEPRADHPVAMPLDPEDETFAEAMRVGLAELAAAAGAASITGRQQRSVHAALDGAELVIRGQLAIGAPEQLRALLPSLVFLIVLPILQQDEALAITRRVAEMVNSRCRRQSK